METQSVFSETRDVKDEPTACFSCCVSIAASEFYCASCIAKGQKRCFVCRRLFTSHFDHLECYRCRSPLSAHELRFVHRDRAGDVFETEVAAWLATTAGWNLEAVRARTHRRRRRRGHWLTPQQLELTLWSAARNNLLDVQRELAIAPEQTDRALFNVVRKTAARVLADEMSNEQFARRDRTT